MLKTSLIALGLILGATTFAVARVDTHAHRAPRAAMRQAPLVEGRSVYVAPAPASPAGTLRPGSYTQELQEEESSSNVPGN